MNSKKLRNLVIKYKENNHIANFDVALDIGISQDTVRRFISGEDVMPRTLEKIEKFFTTDCEGKSELEKLKEENALLKEQLLKKSETEQSFQSLLEENRCLQESIDGAQIIINGYIELTGKYKSALEEIKNVVQYPYKTPHGDSLSAYVVNKIIEVLK